MRLLLLVDSNGDTMVPETYSASQWLRMTGVFSNAAPTITFGPSDEPAKYSCSVTSWSTTMVVCKLPLTAAGQVGK